ncbi:MAG: N-acetylmuramoyl-L-alanine amidase [Chromatiales bacterium]|nr:N-acetylmuramoyl-L-alanine amidase [Chromatiales bacterium]
MKQTGYRLIALLLLCASSQIWAESAVKGMRMWPAPDHTRLVFDTTAPVEHSLFTLKEPDRLVIDIKDTRLSTDTEQLDYSSSLLTGIRSAQRNGKDLRVVLDLKGAVTPKSFVLRPSQEYGHRLVLDLYDSGSKPEPVRTTLKSISSRQKARDIVIAIDAGHGGDDPGAIGPNGVKEKDVVLAIARKLKKMVDQEPGMSAVMIRDGDYFVGLKKRVKLARQTHKADFLISIHADSFNDARARGSSVYTLSSGGATSERARQLAEKENASDLVGGVSLDDKDDLLASVLLDLSQTATTEASVDVASRVLGEIRAVNKLHKRKVEQAGFRVLKAPDVPSILVETAFISNPAEERNLNSSTHQEKMAKAIMEGVRDYFTDNPPPGTVLAMNKKRKHVISQGETLSAIAEYYQVSLNSLRNLNRLESNTLRVGQVLQIPTDS